MIVNHCEVTMATMYSRCYFSITIHGNDVIIPHACTRGEMIGCVCLSSVCLSAQKKTHQFSRSRPFYIVLHIFKLPCLWFFLLDTFYKCLKPGVLSWHRGHAYQPHPDTWPPVQREMTVSVFLGFACICETTVCSYEAHT